MDLIYIIPSLEFLVISDTKIVDISHIINERKID